MVDQSTQALRKGLALAMACDHPDEIADWDINAIRDTLAEAGLAIVPVEPTEAMITAGIYADQNIGVEGVWRHMLRAAQETGT